jgi:enoyl-CoA hydratase
MSPVLVEHPAQGVVWLRLNRPEARNALNDAVRAAFAEHFRVFGEDSTTRCIVLTGNETAFAAGAGMKEVAALGVREMMQTGVR